MLSSALLASIACALGSCRAPEVDSAGPTSTVHKQTSTEIGWSHGSSDKKQPTLKPCSTDVGAPDVHAMTGESSGENDMDGVEFSEADMAGQVDCQLSPGKQDLLDKELDRSRNAVTKYPTFAAAQADGWLSEAPPSPIVRNVHVYKVDRVDGRFDIEEPEMLLFESNVPEARLLAAVYFIASDSETPPSGFTGPNDRWHRHVTDKSACLVSGVIRTELPEKADCTAAGGAMQSGTGWILHVWSVPGVENPDGIFELDRSTE